jgi:hypothetical protein
MTGGNGMDEWVKGRVAGGHELINLGMKRAE